jgi:PTH1 family peptidyl-tRNA hydrolase
MYIIAGLGNPTEEYENTRHNVGFHVIDCLAERNHIDVSEKKHLALLGRGVIGAEKAVLLKPQTYMNSSGDSIRLAADFYKIPADHIIVISDDIDLEQGQLRIRARGSAGGHNGLKSIIAQLKTQEFLRIRVGIGGKPEGWDLADYVLSKLKGSDRQCMEEAYLRAAEAAETIVNDGIDTAMNRFNRKAEEKNPA